MDEPSVSPRPATTGKLASCFASSRVTIHESLVTIPISATESGEALESGVGLGVGSRSRCWRRCRCRCGRGRGRTESRTVPRSREGCRWGRSPCHQHHAVGQQGRRVNRRAVLRLPVAVQVPLAGSYSSALVRGPLLPTPPATSTMPLGSKVAV